MYTRSILLDVNGRVFLFDVLLRSILTYIIINVFYVFLLHFIRYARLFVIPANREIRSNVTTNSVRIDIGERSWETHGFK